MDDVFNVVGSSSALSRSKLARHVFVVFVL